MLSAHTFQEYITKHQALVFMRIHSAFHPSGSGKSSTVCFRMAGYAP